MDRRKVNCIAFTHSDGKTLFLMLKTIRSRGGFWQGVTGSVEEGETFSEAAHRELKEETGLDLNNALSFLEDVYSCKFTDRRGDNVEEHAFGAQFRPDVKVDLKHNVYDEHESYEWVQLEEAIKKLRFETEKEAFVALSQRIKQTEN